MFTRVNLLAIAALLFFSSCSPIKKGLLLDPAGPVIEIAVRKVKEGQKEAFSAARTTFIGKLTAQPGVSNDREFQSFYALPAPDDREVFIGMTQYATGKTVGKVQGKVLGSFMKFAKTMDLKAYVFVQPQEGESFDLGKLASGPGQVLEIAVRRVKPGQEAAFQSIRHLAWFTGRGSGQLGTESGWRKGH